MMVLWKHFLGFLTAKASVYEPFYTLEVSCLAGCDSDLINATQAEAKWVPLDFSWGSSLVLNLFRAIHGILETQNSTLNDPAISSDTIRHHTNCFIFLFLGFYCMSACPTKAGALGLSMWHIRIWCCQQGGGEARWPSFTVHHSSAWKQSETLWNCQANKIEVSFFWPNYRAWPFWFKVLYIGQVAFHCERSFDSIWKLVRTVGCIVPTTRPATLYRRDHRSHEVEISWRLFYV